MKSFRGNSIFRDPLEGLPCGSLKFPSADSWAASFVRETFNAFQIAREIRKNSIGNGTLSINAN